VVDYKLTCIKTHDEIIQIENLLKPYGLSIAVALKGRRNG